MRWRVAAAVWVSVAYATFASSGLRGAESPVTLKVGDHPGFVRIVVGFSESLGRSRIFALDPSPFADGTSAVRVQRGGLAPQPPSVEAAGVHVNAATTRVGLTLRMRSATHRFKYLEYRLLTRPVRVVINLWKSGPPVSARLRAPDGCLSLRHYSVGPGVVDVSGLERNLFEHMFLVRVRTAAGRIVGTRGVAALNGRWSARVRYRVGRKQAGTLEAIDLSEGDSSLVCLTQARVTLTP
jgi:hypothetical protein